MQTLFRLYFLLLAPPLWNKEVTSVHFRVISVLVHHWLQDRVEDLLGKIRLAKESGFVIVR